MSSQNPLNSRNAARFPALPLGEAVENYTSYAEAQSAVDTLARADFPVKQLSIIGNDLKSVEVVTGKMSYGRAALAGAASGAWLGIFLGLILFIFSPTGASMPIIGAALLIGAGFGMLFGIVSYSVKRKRRDFSSVMQLIAVSYTVQAPSELVHRARNILRGEPAAPAAPVAAPNAASSHAVPSHTAPPAANSQPVAQPAPPTAPPTSADSQGAARDAAEETPPAPPAA